MSKLIDLKIDELIELSIVDNDNNTQIILLALRGAKRSGDDFLLATTVQEYTKNVLLPLIQQRKKIYDTSQN